MLDWATVYREIEDKLLPQLELDAWERTVYYHLVRHTKLIGRDSGRFAIGPISKVLLLSDTKIREVFRSLDRKGCTKNEVTRLGYEITVYLPNEISSLKDLNSETEEIDIEQIDFFVERKYLKPLIEREKYRCFYCLSKITEETCELDHVIPQSEINDNSYKNIVCSCHACNRKKGGINATDHIRSIYQQSMLNEAEFQERITAIEELKAGNIIPII